MTKAQYDAIMAGKDLFDDVYMLTFSDNIRIFTKQFTPVEPDGVTLTGNNITVDDTNLIITCTKDNQLFFGAGIEALTAITFKTKEIN